MCDDSFKKMYKKIFVFKIAKLWLTCTSLPPNSENVETLLSFPSIFSSVHSPLVEKYARCVNVIGRRLSGQFSRSSQAVLETILESLNFKDLLRNIHLVAQPLMYFMYFIKPVFLQRHWGTSTSTSSPFQPDSGNTSPFLPNQIMTESQITQHM